MKKKRLFIALELPKNIIEALKKIQKKIKAANICDCKFTKPEQLHLTLKFLGEVDNKQEKIIKDKLKNILFAPFEASLGNLGFINKNEEIKIIYVDVISKKLKELQKLIDSSLKDFFTENTDFLNHITLCRIKQIYNKQAFYNFFNNIEIEDQTFTINEFVLKQSYLKLEGPEHIIIEKYIF